MEAVNVQSATLPNEPVVLWSLHNKSDSRFNLVVDIYDAVKSVGFKKMTEISYTPTDPDYLEAVRFVCFLPLNRLHPLRFLGNEINSVAQQ